MAINEFDFLAPGPRHLLSAGDEGAACADQNRRREVICLLGLPIDVIDLKSAVQRVTQAMRTSERCLVSTPNVNFLVAAQKSVDFRRSIQRSNLVLADGSPLVWMSRLLGAPLPERASGADLFEALRYWPASASTEPMKVYFFGGQPGAAKAAAESLGMDGDVSAGAGYEDPGFGSIDEMSQPGQLDRINASGADFLVVSLGAVKGQSWILRNLDRISPPVVSHLGAVVNFVSGRVARAPKWMQRMHLEWLYRIWQEPNLWRRYSSDGASVMVLIATRLVPFMVWSRALTALRRLRGQRLERSAVLWHANADGGRLELRGDLHRDDMAPLRLAIDQIPMQGRIEVDCKGLRSLDLYALGLLVSAFDTHEEQSVVFTGLHWSLSAWLRFAGAGYLLVAAS